MSYSVNPKEFLEDVSLKVNLIYIIDDNKISIPGILLLTSHRLLFTSLASIMTSSEVSNARNDSQKLLELSTFIMTNDIESIAIFKDEGEDTLYIEMTDENTLVFLFTNISAIQLNKIVTSDMTYAEKCLLRVCGHNSEAIEVSDSTEGPPAQRIFNRLNIAVSIYT